MEQQQLWEWLTKVRPMIVASLVRKGWSRHDAADAAHEAAVVAWKERGHRVFNDFDHFLAWFLVVARNRGHDEFRKRRLKQVGPLTDALAELLPARDDSNQAEQRDLIDWLLRQLTEEERRLIERRYLSADSPVSFAVLGRELYPDRDGAGSLLRAHRVHRSAMRKLLRLVLTQQGESAPVSRVIDRYRPSY